MKCEATRNAAIRLRNVQLPSNVQLNDRDRCDLEMLLMGAFAPVHGYMDFDDFCSVVSDMRLSCLPNVVYAMPIILAIPQSETCESKNWLDQPPQKIKLRDSLGIILAEVVVSDCYKPDLAVFCQSVLKTTDSNHPYVSYLQSHHADCVYVGGEVRMVTPIVHFDFADLRKTPVQTRQEIKEKKWDVVVGFQTRNPMHRSHFELTIAVINGWVYN